MKNFIKNNKILTLIIAFSVLYLSSPLKSLLAAANCTSTAETGKITYCALEPEAFNSFTPTGSDQLGNFLSEAFYFGIALAGGLAVVMIVWGGVEVMLSESFTKKDDGKKKIWGAIWGLLLALVSWLILYTINPEILNFKL